MCTKLISISKTHHITDLLFITNSSKIILLQYYGAMISKYEIGKNITFLMHGKVVVGNGTKSIMMHLITSINIVEML